MYKTVDAIHVQEKIQTMQQNVNLVLLYSMQHGTEDNQFLQQLDLQTYLTGLMS